MSSLRVIHISDLHFTDSARTFDWGPDGPTIDNQDSGKKSAAIVQFLLKNATRLGTDIVIVTGDLTDSGDDGDYKIAQDFVQSLRDQHFMVLAIPGNHDYCIEGNLIFADILSSISQVPTDLPGFDDIVRGILSSAGLPRESVAAICALLDRHPGAADNPTRRQRFKNYITGEVEYPKIVDFPRGRVILLDSMEGELDENDGDLLAQGKLGTRQWSRLTTALAEYQPQRQAGKTLIVALHHSPFHTIANDSNKGLRDAGEFLAMLSGQVDCVLFGHASPDGMSQQGGQDGSRGFNTEQVTYGIPFFNCENLEPVAPAYPVSVLDLGAWVRAVFQADTADEPELSRGSLVGGN
jgi:3',5'-cyclic AMP phosphodiesterase CpdA